mmetsp:Transcript_43878/g.93909  ORF Transcript_43878/g.93909 Transcript_43878/m.93909 type:complete len:328 (+) Transcript_43878:70-1053(+)|eukprot:CAMPEP_0206470436 /NCGR_PEP_ID=MMETSP0324_2-20121206/30930_1 /ASSEMBLY_ACC=CAM_ASM_000836 /TAXON_ID=2866 /ORGANISM="Crypthecodinium cohnii, Strain Seligo" /LENGTH=327 /DNA_ID=CAMNT_0053944497 /DNA_START=11 /DNA_END=994 /DNA_ORIENTATION=-
MTGSESKDAGATGAASSGAASASQPANKKGERVSREERDSEFDQAQADAGKKEALALGVLPKAPEDVPDSAVSGGYHKQSNTMIFHFYHGEDKSSRVRFQVVGKSCGEIHSVIKRVALLCKKKFEDGHTKEDVLTYRTELLTLVAEAIGLEAPKKAISQPQRKTKAEREAAAGDGTDTPKTQKRKAQQARKAEKAAEKEKKKAEGKDTAKKDKDKNKEEKALKQQEKQKEKEKEKEKSKAKAAKDSAESAAKAAKNGKTAAAKAKAGAAAPAAAEVADSSSDEESSYESSEEEVGRRVGKAAAKMLIRSALRCACHYSTTCPTKAKA